MIGGAYLKKTAVIDSGVGGLAILSRLVGALPAEYHYFADNAFMPYGNMNRHQLLDRACHIIDSLLCYDIDSVVLACNTLSVATLPRLRYMYPDLTIYGCEPPIGQALQYTASRCVLVATPYVVEHTVDNASLVKVKLANLATMVEEDVAHTAMYQYIERELQSVPFFDSIILGCTHYSHIKDIFHQLYPAVKVFDSVDGLVAHIKKRNKRDKHRINSSVDVHLSAEDEYLADKIQQKIQQFFKYY